MKDVREAGSERRGKGRGAGDARAGDVWSTVWSGVEWKME